MIIGKPAVFQRKECRLLPETVKFVSEIHSELKQIELNILVEFNRICCKHDIKYSLYAGTLLGAVRHKGFIPWDDIDVVLTRDEYVKFVIISSELSQEYTLLSVDNNNEYSTPLAKIIDNRTGMISFK